MARKRRSAVAVLVFCASCSGNLFAQQDWSITVQGTVVDTLTGKPIAGAIVDLNRDPPSRRSSSLPDEGGGGQEKVADASGRFSFTFTPNSRPMFNVSKPGYISSTADLLDFSTYFVEPMPGMGDLQFYLTPEAEISGRVLSDTGQPIKQVPLQLYREVIRDGRTAWERAQFGKIQWTAADGSYHYTGLHPGAYVLISEWMLEGDPGSTPGSGCGGADFVTHAAYPPSATPGVLDFSKAQPIVLQQGQHVVSDLKVRREPLHPVTWGNSQESALADLIDRNGRVITIPDPGDDSCGENLPSHFDQATRTASTDLPDGNYMMAIQPVNNQEGQAKPALLGTYFRFAVNGAPASVPSVPINQLPTPATRINVHLDLTAPNLCSGMSSIHTGTRPPGSQPRSQSLWLTRDDPLPGVAAQIPFPEKKIDDGRAFDYLVAGSYWVHAGQSGMPGDPANTYIASITAGGEDMAQKPLVVGLNGTAPPLEVTLRDDCGILQLHDPQAGPNPNPVGVVTSFYGLLVPQFAGFMNVHSFAFQLPGPEEIAVGNLAPGHYKLYLSWREQGVAFRESGTVPPGLGPGQDIWLTPGKAVDVKIVPPPASQKSQFILPVR
ncbi:MAG: carboxypeptidase-like regulatory domain-containing protein [Acidobacteriaceae bacterium]